jgi:glycosyltransferase involved in cell wall biosynthesis
VIAKSGNAVADDIEESGAGIVFDRWSELPAALAGLAERQTYSERAMARFEQEYTESAWVDRIQSVYRDATTRA